MIVHQYGMAMCQSHVPDWSPEAITGLDPAPEEAALLELEFGCDGLPTHSSTCPTDFSLGQHTVHANRSNAKKSYHIHQEDDIDICSHFLAGQCPRGLLCPNHHTALPYLWQLRRKDTTLWWSFDEGDQLVLEKLYSDPTRERACAARGDAKQKIDLNLMTIQRNRWCDRIRRLSTTSCTKAEFHTVYKYYYEENPNKWAEYEPSGVKCIKDGLRNEYERILYSSGRHKYSLDLINMVQTNLDTETKRRMRRRPIYRSPILMNGKPRAFSRASHNASNVATCSWRDIRYPVHWRITNTSLIYEKSTVASMDSEYFYVYTYFHKTMEESKYVIEEISRIQNYFQCEKYSRKKTYMENHLKDAQYGCLERYLFHGTSPSHLKAICTQNFDPRVSGRHATIYGKGSYFARDASYSHNYSPPTEEGDHYMFLAKVLVGRPALGNPSYTRPPPLNRTSESSLLYDSCVDRPQRPNIFIIFDNDQVYPYFIIKYRALQNVLHLD
ncbi:protein mono-ADP-ribosyltransferase TIPARP-like [Hyperolius riggenbachi]|uniref:protein mono-ADP-ribosyltransferase TIPARP-like n=1 Tax=Hyperolius riggenbachi TaxID=752182 RepID=UPI0035A377D2